MEYFNLVSQIVAAEHSAKEIVREAQEQESSLEERLAQETADMRQRYFERAQHRVSEVQKAESAGAKQDMALWDEKLAVAMAAVEGSYEKNKQHWVDTLFAMIVGSQV